MSMMAVLIVAKLFGVFGVIVAVPMAAVVMVLIRRVVIHRLYEGRVPATRGRPGSRAARSGAGCRGHRAAPMDVLRDVTKRTAERSGATTQVRSLSVSATSYSRPNGELLRTQCCAFGPACRLVRHALRSSADRNPCACTTR